MRFKSILILLISFTLTTTMFAQRNCGSMDYLQQQIANDPERAANMEAIERNTQEWIERNQATERAVITIPVVVHIVYNNSNQNITDAQVQSQIDVLNEDFRRTNSDADNTWSQAADSEIEFCLASQDPNGASTNGITRTTTSVSSFGTNDGIKFDAQGGKDAWNTDAYLNMWGGKIGGGILGYAQFPGGSSNTDGVVCGYQYFGTTGTATAPFNLGRTTTHEVGHWLNLRHIWGDGGCNVDDQVSDTPQSDAANYGCATGHSSCSSTDMVQNYMDYSDDACMNLFTAGQKSRMQAVLSGSRSGLASSNGCGAGTPPAPTCSDGIQNGNETGVDCGGSCAACPTEPTCSDGIQNGNETGVDCGGSCAACPTNCTDNTVVVSITTDNYGGETSWVVTNSNGQTVGQGGGNYGNNQNYTEELCLPDGCYDFVISDTYGDGICCQYGNGSYSVTSDGSSLASGGQFGSSATNNFCVGNTPPAPTCDDGIQNGNETGVDCGGSCPACPPVPTCDDGIQNGNETGVDCGGSCPACPPTPTCNDGIQNGNETGVDCGGSCDPCNTGCNENKIVISVTTDNYGGETSWVVTNSNGQTVGQGGNYNNNQTYSEELCLPDGCYDFTISDTYGDGICCQYGNGSYTVESDDGILASGGQFGSSETTNFCPGGGTPPPTPTCDDGIQNGNETGVDCGGSCAPCAPTPTCDDGIQNGNETGVDCGGSCAPCQAACINMTLFINPDDYGSEITWRLRRTGSGGGLIATGGPYQDGNTNTIEESFCLEPACYRLRIFDAYGDGICCEWGDGSYELVTDGGTVLASGGEYGSSETTNFCVDGSTQRQSSVTIEPKASPQFQIYPNPTNGNATAAIENAKPNSTIYIFNTLGMLVEQIGVQEGNTTAKLDAGNYPTGIYLIRLDDGVKPITKKLSVIR